MSTSKIVSETFYGRREPQWLVESPKEQQSHFDQRGCVRQIKSSSHASATRHTENDNLPTSRSRAGYFAEQPSALNHVYNAVPAATLHQTPVNTSFTNIPVVEFMVPLCCGKCVEKVKEELENDEGVYRVVCDLHNQRVTVSSNSDPQWLLQRIKRIKRNSHFWRGSTYLKDAHYVTTSFPSQKPSYHSQSHYVETPAHHRRSPPQLSSQIRRSPYDDVETQYVRRSADPEYRYAGAQYQYMSSRQPYKTPYNAPPMYDDANGTPFTPVPIHHGHLPSSYDLPYETEDYTLYY